MSLTLNSPTDVGLTVGNQPVFKAGRLVEFIPMSREITFDPDILQHVQGLTFLYKLYCTSPTRFLGQVSKMPNNMKLFKLRFKGLFKELHLVSGEFV